MKKSLKIKECTTKKLFYKKWLYKIVLKCGGISYLHRMGIDYINSIVPSGSMNSWSRLSAETIVKNRDNLIHIAGILESILPIAKHQIRVEGATCGIFTNDLNLIEQIKSKLGPFVSEIHRPETEEQGAFLMANKNRVLCNELPLDGYKFRLYFKNGDLNPTALSNFLSWANKYNDGRIHIPSGARRILEGSAHPYFYGQYFYARDQKITSMALLAMGEFLNKTEEFVLKSEVNA